MNTATSAKEEILSRVRGALARSAGPEGVEGEARSSLASIPRGYRQSSDLRPGAPDTVDLFVERLIDYKAGVTRVGEAELVDAVSTLVSGDAIVVIPPGLDWARQLHGVEIRVDSREEPLSHHELDAVGAAVTAARLGIAETGVFVLDGEADQGRRAITLVPDHHVCVIRASQVVGLVPEATAILAQHPTRPLTWVAGPSATSDIELQRIEGVHGPRRLDVVIVEG